MAHAAPASADAGADARGEPILAVSGLHAEFHSRNGPVTAVRGVDMVLHRGEKVGLVGESGSGKSAFALSVMGLIEPQGRVTKGAVTLAGRDMLGITETQLDRIRGRDISIVFQDPSNGLDPLRQVGEQIDEAIRTHNRSLSRSARRERVVRLLEEVEIPQATRRLHAYPHELSGGMKQRVIIAMALANNPSILVADEPTTALDATTQKRIIDLLERLTTERHSAVLFVTHNLGLVASFCDRVLVMYAGRVVEQGPTAAVLHRPTHPYTRALLECVPRPGAHGDLRLLPTIPGHPPSLQGPVRGCAFEPRCRIGRGQTVCADLAPPTVTIGDQRSECHFADRAQP